MLPDDGKSISRNVAFLNILVLADDDEYEYFCGMVYSQLRPFPEIFTIANLRQSPAGFEPAQNLSSGFVE